MQRFLAYEPLHLNYATHSSLAQLILLHVHADHSIRAAILVLILFSNL